MFPTQNPQTDPDKLSRRGDSNQLLAEEKKGQDENAKADAALAHEVDRVLWKDSAFRATDYDNIDVRVGGGIVHLYGHVSSLTNQHRAERVLQSIPGLRGVNNYLVPDDRLLAEVATALGSLEQSYDCNFFIGVSHGVVLLSGNVSDAKVKLLAEKCAASNPNVRGVINNVLVAGAELGSHDQPFLQPKIGEIIYFLDGISGVVKHVIINPDNRRVIAMTLQGRFTVQQQESKSLSYGKAPLAEQLVVVPTNVVRYLTKVSGFLYIRSNERNRYMDFDPNIFTVPNKDWNPPYPYHPDDVLFPVKYQSGDLQVAVEPNQLAFAKMSEDSTFKEQFFATDSFGV